MSYRAKANDVLVVLARIEKQQEGLARLIAGGVDDKGEIVVGHNAMIRAAHRRLDELAADLKEKEAARAVEARHRKRNFVIMETGRAIVATLLGYGGGRAS